MLTKVSSQCDPICPSSRRKQANQRQKLLLLRAIKILLIKVYFSRIKKTQNYILSTDYKDSSVNLNLNLRN